MEGDVLRDPEHGAETVHDARVERGRDRHGPRARAVSIRFCAAGTTEFAAPGGMARAKTTHGTSFGSGRKRRIDRWVKIASPMGIASRW